MAMERNESKSAFEPWPWILGSMLAAMIATSLTFYGIAASHPDAEVERTDVRSTEASPPDLDAHGE